MARISIAAFSTCFGSSDSTTSTTSKRPRLVKLSFQRTPGHSLLMCCDTAAASCSARSYDSITMCVSVWFTPPVF